MPVGGGVHCHVIIVVGTVLRNCKNNESCSETET